MIRRPPRSTRVRSSAASDVYKRQAQYFAALGAVEFGKDEESEVGIYMGTECLEDYITVGRQAEKAKSGAAGLSTSEEELAGFKQKYTIPKFVGAKFGVGETVRG